MQGVKIAWMAAAAMAASVGLGAPTVAGAATCAGNCGHSGPNGDVIAPPSSSTFGWVSTYNGVNGAGEIASVGGTDGSLFTTSAFSANAGDVLKYDFNFVTSDGQRGAGAFIYEDYAFVQLVDAATGTPVAMLFNARTEPSGNIVPGTGLPPIDPGVVLTPGTVGISAGSDPSGGPVWAPLGTFSGQCWGAGCGLTGWIHSDYAVPASGTYMLQFGVTNWGDTVYDTGLAYSGLQIGGVPINDDVPEPATWAVMLVGLAGIGGALRRRRLSLAALGVAL